MIILRLILSILLPLYLGYCLVAMIYRDKKGLGNPERFGLSWGIGLGALGMFMYTISLVRISLNLLTVAGPVLIFVLALTIYLISKNIPLLDLRLIRLKLSIPEAIILLLIALTIAYVFFDALVKPIVNFDDLWRQGCIAKIIFTSGRVLTEQAVELAGPHPYLNPISQAWIYLGIGAWNDALGKIVFALCFASLVFVFYGGVRRYASRLHALVFTYLLTSFPLIVYHAGTAYSDLMQAFYYSTGMIYLFHWMNSKNKPDLYISALFFGLGNFIKQTGIPLWLMAAVILATYIFFEQKKAVKELPIFIFISSLVSSPWLLGPKSSLISYLKLFSGKILSFFSSASSISPGVQAPEQLAYAPPTMTDIIYQLTRRMFTYADWQILWFVLIMVVAFKWREVFCSKLKYVLLAIALFFAMLIYIFSEYGIYRFLLDGTLVHRAMMWQVPLVLYFVALALSRSDTR